MLSLEDLLESARVPALVVVLDGVEDPRNLGAIVRTAEAAGADGVVLPERHSAGLSETVARASAGALEHVKVARVGNLVQALETLNARGIWVVGFDATGNERWDAVDLGHPVALVLGGEGRGIRRLVREHCDHLVSIPHFGHVGSLNVSVAAGIALYEAVRQRRAVPSIVRPIPARPAPFPRIVGPAPDDAETDPGARPLALQDSPDLGDEGDDSTTPVRHVEPHEDVAWGQGPTVLKPAGHERVRRNDGRRGKKRRRPPSGGDRDFGGRAPAAPSEGRAAPPQPQGRRKGRRRRGPRDGDSPAGGPPRLEPGASEGAPPEAPADATPPPDAPSPPSGPRQASGGAPGRRRRRRRRH